MARELIKDAAARWLSHWGTGGCSLLSEMSVLIHLPRLLLALFFFTATGHAVGLEAAPFFERNCLDCHETGTTKGGLKPGEGGPSDVRSGTG